mmetsp:Transcript_4058/g.10164  ORF Transcript_4058/g.10164 Transcript_4058/m.10164 type:complete len:239 (-) Transcript_4058:114-830(-)
MSSCSVAAGPANKAAKRKSPSIAGHKSISRKEQRMRSASSNGPSARPAAAAASARAAAPEPPSAFSPCVRAAPAAHNSPTSSEPKPCSSPASHAASASPAPASKVAPVQLPLLRCLRSCVAPATKSLRSGKKPAAVSKRQSTLKSAKLRWLPNASEPKLTTCLCKAANSSCKLSTARPARPLHCHASDEPIACNSNVRAHIARPSAVPAAPEAARQLSGDHHLCAEHIATDFDPATPS